METKMIYDVGDKPTKGKWFILSLQHVFAMFGATVLVPLLTGIPISVALFSSGVGTLIYILCTRAKVPIYLGSSFAYIGVIIAVSNVEIGSDGLAISGTGHYGSVLTALLVVGIIYAIIAVVIKYVGTNWMDKILPPIIIGPMIAIIGFSLAGTAVSQAGLNGGSYKEILTAIASFLTVVIVSLKGKGFLKIIPFLVGILVGYIVASLFGLIDFTNIINVLKTPKLWFKIPDFMFLWFKDSTTNILGNTTTITTYQMNFTALLTVVPLALVTASEHIGDHAVLSEIVGRDFLKDPGLDKTLMGDGLATTFAAMIGGPANTSYGENTSVVGMTKIASVWVTGLAAVMVIFLSFFNVFVALISSIPAAVMGGISIILYGFIGLNGIKVLIEKKVDFNKTKNLIIASTMLVLGLGGAVIGGASIQISGMALAAIVGITLNLTLKEEN